MNKTLLGVLVVVAVIAVAGLFLPLAKQTIVKNEYAAASPANTSFNSSKTAQINITPSTAAGTTTSLTNTDAYDRIIVQGLASCSNLGTSQTPYIGGNGPGLSSLEVTMSTSSTADATNPAFWLNTNNAAHLDIATTTASDAYTASSTWTGGAFQQRWAAGSVMTFKFNATNTAACTVGLQYIGS